MKEDSVFDMIKECAKVFNEIKKKHADDLNNCLEKCLNNLNSLKESLKNQNQEGIDENLFNITVSFLEASKKTIHLKYTKYFLNMLILLKKFIEYNLFYTKKSNSIIGLLKEYSYYSKLKDDCQNKILENIQSLMFSPYLDMKYEVLSNVYLLILKSFINVNHSKIKDFKNPIKLILTTITEKIFTSKKFEIIIPIITFIFSWYNLSFKKREDIDDDENYDDDDYFNNSGSKFKFDNEFEYKLRKELMLILNKNIDCIYIRFLSLELLSQGLIKIHEKNEQSEQEELEIDDDKPNINHLKKFIKEKIVKEIISSIKKIKNDNSITNDDELSYLHYLKLCRLVKVLLMNYNIRYDIIITITEMINDKNNKVLWKKYLSFEFLENLINKYDFLTKLNEIDEKYISSIFNSITNFANYIDTLKDDNENKKSDVIILNFLKKKELENNRIYLDGDEIMLFKEQNKRFYKYLLDESLNSIINSLVKEGQNIDKKMLNIICDNLKRIINKLILNEIEKNNNMQSGKECALKKYNNFMMNIISLLGSLDMHEKGDSILKQLCKSAINFPENNDENNIYLALSLMKLLKSTDSLSKEAISMVLITLEVFNRRYNTARIKEYNNSELEDIFKKSNIYKKYQTNKGDDYNNSSNNINNNITNNIANSITNKITNEDDDEDDNNKENEDYEDEDEYEYEYKIKKKINKIEKENYDKENEDYRRIRYRKKLISDLCKGIDSIFTDMPNLETNSLKHIIESLSSCINLCIKFKLSKDKKNDLRSGNELNDSIIKKEENIFYYKIYFYFTKILTITQLNIENIYILFEPFISTINDLIDNKFLVDFSLEILCFFISEILKNHEIIESSIKKNINEENKIWIENEWQKLLFTRFLTMLSQPELYKLIKNKIFNCLKKIIQKNVKNLDSFGWESIIQSYCIISNYDVENTFLSVKRLLSDYNSNLSLINIIPIMKLLKSLILNKKDQKTSISSLELFWHCASIIDDYKQDKRQIKENEKKIYDNLLKEKELNVYCDELFFKLLSHILTINEEDRIEVVKTGIKIFTNIFSSKMNNINHEICLQIINDIFFKIFVTNAEKYKANNKKHDLEMAFQISLISVVIILRTYFGGKEAKEEEEKKMFEDYLNIITEIIPFGSQTLITNILKSIQEIKMKNEENVLLIVTRLDLYFKLIMEINNFIKSPKFQIKQENKSIIYILFNTILSSFRSIFITSNHLEIYTKENVKKILIVIDTILKTIPDLEPESLKLKPRKIVDIENDVFNFLDKMLVKNNCILDYLIKKMEIDIKNPHSEAICQRALKSFQDIITNKEDKNIYGLKKEELETIQNLIEKITDIINLRNENEIMDFLIKTNPEPNQFQEGIIFKKYFSYFINIFDAILENYLKYKKNINIEENEEKEEEEEINEEIKNEISEEKKEDLKEDKNEEIKEEQNEQIKEDKNKIINSVYAIIDSVLNLFEEIFKESNIDLKLINTEHIPLLNDNYQQMRIESISFIGNKLIFYILSLFGDEEEEKQFKKLENKIMKIIKLSSEIFDGKINNYSLTQINELIKICQYQSVNEIAENVQKIDKDKKLNLDKFIGFKIKIAKICSNLLIQKLIEILKNYREYEKKLNEIPMNPDRVKEIVEMLDNIKNLELFPNINQIEPEEEVEVIKKEISIFDLLSKTKKIHLFYLQPILNEFVYTNEKKIKNKIKVIFDELNKILNVPNINDLNE